MTATEDKRGPAFLHSIAERTSALYSIMNEKGIDPRPPSGDSRSAKRDHLSGVSGPVPHIRLNFMDGY